MHKKKRPLTHQQRLFLENYLRHGNATKAALQAGYAKASAGVTGSQMLRNNKTIMFEVEKATRRSDKRAAYNYEQAMEESKEGMDLARDTENAGAFVNAAKLRAQLSGLLVEKLQVQAGFSVQISGIDDAPGQVTEAVAKQIVSGDIRSLIGGEDGEGESDD